MIRCENTCEVINDNVCCKSCNKNKTCESDYKCSMEATARDSYSGCKMAILEQSLEIFQNKNLKILENIAAIITEKKKLEEKEKTLKEELEKAMTENGVKKFSNDFISISWVEPTTTETFDSATFKKDNPELAKKYIKISSKKGYVKITLKEEK